MKLTYVLNLLLIFILSSCSEENPDKPTFTIGKNQFKIQVDGKERIYFVHVPPAYSHEHETPVVIMFHGTGQSGEQFYNISGWKEVGDVQNILTVFPSALSYCISEDGNTEQTTKWNVIGANYTYCNGEIPTDDIHFVREIIKQLKENYNVDSHRIYTVGFSNGGEFAARTALDMSNELAASTSTGGGGAMPRDTTIIPSRKLPVMLIFGNQDGKILTNLGLSSNASIPMGFDSVYTKYPFLYKVQVDPYIRCFELNDKNYNLFGDTSSIVYADYYGLSGIPENTFRIVEIKNLQHEYPNGINHPLNGALHNWEWFKQFKLP
ncbi:MAG: dienelactone hydrolase family protein [Saprospiraceae bacterium]|nr:dienelactone hydrolase family protein [Saprospiraceae bacterium]